MGRRGAAPVGPGRNAPEHGALEHDVPEPNALEQRSGTVGRIGALALQDAIAVHQEIDISDETIIADRRRRLRNRGHANAVICCNAA